MDLEGTLLRKEYRLDNGKVAPSAWTLLAERLGAACYEEEEATKDRWTRHVYRGYVEWMRDTIRIHQKYGLTAAFFSEVMDSVPLTAGVEEAVAEFKVRGAITAVISGGFKALADRVQRHLRIDHSLSGCEYFFDSAGHIEHFNLLPSDEEGKADFMHLIAKEYGVSPRDCAFVGDGKNDVALAQSVGLSIAFNAQPELQAVCGIIIAQELGSENFQKVAQEIRFHAG